MLVVPRSNATVVEISGDEKGREGTAAVLSSVKPPPPPLPPLKRLFVVEWNGAVRVAELPLLPPSLLHMYTYLPLLLHAALQLWEQNCNAGFVELSLVHS